MEQNKTLSPSAKVQKREATMVIIAESLFGWQEINARVASSPPQVVGLPTGKSVSRLCSPTTSEGDMEFRNSRDNL